MHCGIRLVLMCALTLSVGGCFQQHDVDEPSLTPAGSGNPGGGSPQGEPGDEGRDAGVSEPPPDDAATAQPGIPGLPSAEQCAEADPNDVLMQLLCALAEGAAGGGTPAGGILGGNGNGGITLPTPLECLTTKDPIIQLVCALAAAATQGGGTPAGGLLGGGGNLGGTTPGGFPISIPTADDCADLSKADFITRILCAFVTSGNGFSGGVPGGFVPAQGEQSSTPAR